MTEVRMLSVTPILGYGFPESSLQYGMAQQPHAIGADGGSTDPGPFYLGNGTAFCSRVSIKRDLKLTMIAGLKAGIPVIVSTAGGAGGEPHLKMMSELVHEIALEEKLSFKLALIHSEQDPSFIKKKVKEGKIHAASKQPDLTEEQVETAVRIVGLMGPEPYIKALDDGAQVILAGRSTDPAPWAAVAIRMGIPPAQAWYSGKMLECGSEPAIPKKEGCLLARVTSEYVELEPTNTAQKCTVLSVANFALHENSSPIHHLEPGGMLDTSNCKFEQHTDRTVRVSGMQWKPSDVYTIKLEGVRRTGYKAITICATRDPILIRGIDRYLENARLIIQEKTLAFGVDQNDYQLAIRCYGRDGVMSDREPDRDPLPHEMCFIAEVLATSQDIANSVIGIVRLTLLHSDFPDRMCKEGNMAIPFSPSDIEMGAGYEFNVYHIMEVDHPHQLFPIEYLEVGNQP